MAKPKTLLGWTLHYDIFITTTSLRLHHCKNTTSSLTSLQIARLLHYDFFIIFITTTSLRLLSLRLLHYDFINYDFFTISTTSMYTEIVCTKTNLGSLSWIWVRYNEFVRSEFENDCPKFALRNWVHYYEIECVRFDSARKNLYVRNACGIKRQSQSVSESGRQAVRQSGRRAVSQSVEPDVRIWA